jgi:hypothetical protein
MQPVKALPSNRKNSTNKHQQTNGETQAHTQAWNVCMGKSRTIKGAERTEGRPARVLGWNKAFHVIAGHVKENCFKKEETQHIR